MVDFNVPDPNKEGANLSFYVEKRMIKFLDKVKKLITQKDKDYVIIIDGYEGSGKSTAAQQWGKYVDPTLCLERICMTADEFKKAILTAEKGQCVIYDEAVTGMTSGDTISRIGKLLKSLMMQMRQKNLFVIVILPSIFELNKYAVLSRCRSFFHIYENKGRMGYFVGYNRKDARSLYLKGKTTYAYKVKSRFIGRFYGKYVVNEKDYRAKKELALQEVEEKEDKGKPRWLLQRNIAIYCLYKFLNSYRKIAQAFKFYSEGKEGLSHDEVGEVIKELNGKFGECKL